MFASRSIVGGRKARKGGCLTGRPKSQARPEKEVLVTARPETTLFPRGAAGGSVCAISGSAGATVTRATSAEPTPAGATAIGATPQRIFGKARSPCNSG